MTKPTSQSPSTASTNHVTSRQTHITPTSPTHHFTSRSSKMTTQLHSSHQTRQTHVTTHKSHVTTSSNQVTSAKPHQQTTHGHQHISPTVTPHSVSSCKSFFYFPVYSNKISNYSKNHLITQYKRIPFLKVLTNFTSTRVYCTYYIYQTSM